MSGAATPKQAGGRGTADRLFLLALALAGGSYIVLILALVLADALYTSPSHLWEALSNREIQAAIRLTLISCTLSAILSLWVAIPLSYLLSRYAFPGRWFVDTLLDIPIVLPPLVLGLSLLVLFHFPIGGTTLESLLQSRLGLSVTFAVPSVILAQFTVACAFATRTLRVAFDQISPRTELVALTLGCSRAQAFWRIVLPQAWRGIVAAGTLAWSRSLGEFGPILVFSGITRMKTEVLSTTVFLELSTGNLEAALAVSLLMIAVATLVLLFIRALGLNHRQAA